MNETNIAMFYYFSMETGNAATWPHINYLSLSLLKMLLCHRYIKHGCFCCVNKTLSVELYSLVIKSLESYWSKPHNSTIPRLT